MTLAYLHNCASPPSPPSPLNPDTAIQVHVPRDPMRPDYTTLTARDPYADDGNRILEYHVASSTVMASRVLRLSSKTLSSPTSWRDVAPIRNDAFDCHVACRLQQGHVCQPSANTKDEKKD
ncbi:hypothetical protein NM688_g1927 [Phlebia brevispora]|uniref:Uncharacterized protein n=1 Tax=Phlebia brevispora TaxID=194682 RepID=A0ACC1TA48_9APHY|nr:hypothetical protein NM688_g1927 [Phlebia brevispora]